MYQEAVPCQCLDAGCFIQSDCSLKRINDDVSTLDQQMATLNRCRPYRLFHCDYTQGVGHFRVPMSQGLKIIQQMRGSSVARNSST